MCFPMDKPGLIPRLAGFDPRPLLHRCPRAQRTCVQLAFGIRDKATNTYCEEDFPVVKICSSEVVPNVTSNRVPFKSFLTQLQPSLSAWLGDLLNALMQFGQPKSKQKSQRSGYTYHFLQLLWKKSQQTPLQIKSTKWQSILQEKTLSRPFQLQMNLHPIFQPAIAKNEDSRCWCIIRVRRELRSSWLLR